MEKICPICRGTFPVKPSHAHKRMYCSRTCLGDAYRVRMQGILNPNHKGLSRKCKQCGSDFKSYVKSRVFCSSDCYGHWRAERAESKPKTVRKRKPEQTSQRACARCGSEFSGKRWRKFCVACRYSVPRKTRPRVGMSAETIARNTHICMHCGAQFVRQNDGAKYCGYACFVADGGPHRAGSTAMLSRRMRGVHKEDFNHRDITDAFKRLGAIVLNFSMVGAGCPDIFVMRAGRAAMVEVKNPDTGYGRRGLNKNQERARKEIEAAGCHMHIVRTQDDVIKLMANWTNESDPMG